MCAHIHRNWREQSWFYRGEKYQECFILSTGQRQMTKEPSLSLPHCLYCTCPNPTIRITYHTVPNLIEEVDQVDEMGSTGILTIHCKNWLLKWGEVFLHVSWRQPVETLLSGSFLEAYLWYCITPGSLCFCRGPLTEAACVSAEVGPFLNRHLPLLLAYATPILTWRAAVLCALCWHRNTVAFGIRGGGSAHFPPSLLSGLPRLNDH